MVIYPSFSGADRFFGLGNDVGLLRGWGLATVVMLWIGKEFC